MPPGSTTGGARPAQHRQRHLLRRHAGQPARPPAGPGLAGRGARPDRHQPQGRLPLDTLTANSGFTETPSDNPAKTDLSDSPVSCSPARPTSKSYASYVGAVNVTASSYGNSVSYSQGPGLQRHRQQLRHGLDHGYLRPDPKGEWWQSQFTNPVSTDHITSVQPQRATARWVSKVTLTFDGKDPVTYDLNASSHVTPATFTFPAQTFHTLRVTIDSTTNNTAPPPAASAVGFSEIEIPGQSVRQVVQMRRRCSPAWAPPRPPTASPSS